MKKGLSLLGLAFALLFCGCNLLSRTISSSQASIETVHNWSFQYNTESNDFSVLFGFLDKYKNAITSDAEVSIRIVDSSDTELYRGSKSITRADFQRFIKQSGESALLADIHIPLQEIAEGYSSSGTVYLHIDCPNKSYYDLSCSAIGCLPVKAASISAVELPFEVVIKDYSKKTKSKIVVESLRYSFDASLTPQMDIYISGTKTYGKDPYSDSFGYKIYDSKGYMVKSGSIFLSDLEKGDKFKDEKIWFYDVTPGESYTIKFSDKY